MAEPPVTIEAALRHGIWRITLDGKFYGDYRTKVLAADAAESLARKTRIEGRTVDLKWKG